LIRALALAHLKRARLRDALSEGTPRPVRAELVASEMRLGVERFGVLSAGQGHKRVGNPRRTHDNKPLEQCGEVVDGCGRMWTGAARNYNDHRVTRHAVEVFENGSTGPACERRGT
jgi:hypothetical protein